jgi:integrase
VWTVTQLQTFLRTARPDRFFALWVLEATSGIRRSELAGVRRELLDLEAGTLAIEVTRVSVDGKVVESDGKTENARRVLALDPFTLAALRSHVEMLKRERAEFGPDYRGSGLLFSGRMATPCTRTRSRAASRNWLHQLVSPRLTFTMCATATRLWPTMQRSTGRR